MKEKIMRLIADELGVEFGEKFYMKNSEFQYKLERDGFYYSDKNYERWNRILLEDLINNNEYVIKKPWVPKVGEPFYSIMLSGEIEKIVSCGISRNVLCVLAMGGIWRTREEAEAHKEEFLDRLDRIMKGELVVKFEEVEK